jgi:hypothetical protein
LDVIVEPDYAACLGIASSEGVVLSVPPGTEEAVKELG